MIVPAGIDILQPGEMDVLGPDVGPCPATVRSMFPVCARPARLGARVDKSRLLLGQVREKNKRRRIDAQKKKTLDNEWEWLWGT